MTATNNKVTHTTAAYRERSTGTRGDAPRKHRQYQQQPRQYAPNPAAGAHAASHLINEDATPGAGVLPSHAHASGREVDGGAG